MIAINKKRGSNLGTDRWRRSEAKTEEERENVDVLYSGPSLIRDPLLHPPPSRTLKKQNSVLTSRWRGAEGRAGRVGGKLGNQM